MMKRVIIFAGTSEGRLLADFCSRKGIEAHVCVATEYGEELLDMDNAGNIENHQSGKDAGNIENYQSAGNAGDIENHQSAGNAGKFIIHRGRMDADEMAEFIYRIKPDCVVDATHPYADLATSNIKEACQERKVKLIRLLRESMDIDKLKGIISVSNIQEAAEYLESASGKIFLTTGLKELSAFAGVISDKSRIYARVLLQKEVFTKMQETGLTRQQIICMQGPFSKELNKAMLEQTGAAYLVTKESGQAGGFLEKINAAAELSIPCIVIRRPLKESGFSLEEVEEMLLSQDSENTADATEPGNVAEVNSEETGAIDSEEASGIDSAGTGVIDSAKTAGSEAEDMSSPAKRIVTLVGIGMGNPSTMTVEAVEACKAADCIIGAKRMLESLTMSGMFAENNSLFSESSFLKTDSMTSNSAGTKNDSGILNLPVMKNMYKSDEICSFIQENQEYKNIVIALSGDVGFYSGAKKIIDGLTAKEEDDISGRADGLEIRQICGISSVMYLASKLGMPWEDMALCSIHGRDQNILSAVRNNEKVFCLASYGDSVRTLAAHLSRNGLSQVYMYVGSNLSYPDEKIYEGCAYEFEDFECSGICCLVIVNEEAPWTIVSQGIPDGHFVRGKVPMTKEEVRSVIISRLNLTRNAIVYDVGAGTGSVSIECALIADMGNVYSIERKSEALSLMDINRSKFGISNMKIVNGEAPDGLEELPAPTHVFIGGSNGKLKEIIDAVREKNSHVRVVISCIAMETQMAAMSYLTACQPECYDICTVNISRTKQVGKYNMMTAQNPVTIFTMQF